MEENKRFNIRVYGLMISKQQVLLADEIIQGRNVTKFPGGGLEWGEGPIECLKREWREETGLTIEVGEHFYTTDFFQLSAFDSNDQVINIYYEVEAFDLTPLETNFKSFKDLRNEGEEVFRWQPIQFLSSNELALPIDKHVCKMLHEQPNS